MNMKKQLALGGALLTAATAACLKLAQWAGKKIESRQKKKQKPNRKRERPEPLPLIICVSPLPALQQAVVDAVHHVGPVHYGQVVGHHDDAAVFVMGQLQQQVDDVVAVLAV